MLPELSNVLAGLRLGRPLHYYPEIGSTNDEARGLAQSGAPEGTLVAADSQTAGRGRAGRRWLTPPGAALAFSLVLRPRLAPAQAARLTMLAGLAVAEAVDRRTKRPVALKWPNDLLVGGEKAGGILVESEVTGDRLDFAIVGIGLNISFVPPPEIVDFPATSLQAADDAPVERAGLLRAIVANVETLYPMLDGDGEALTTRWAARLAWLGKDVIARGAETEVVGRAEGVEGDGALVLRLPSGEMRRVLAGEVRLRAA